MKLGVTFSIACVAALTGRENAGRAGAVKGVAITGRVGGLPRCCIRCTAEIVEVRCRGGNGDDTRKNNKAVTSALTGLPYTAAPLAVTPFVEHLKSSLFGKRVSASGSPSFRVGIFKPAGQETRLRGSTLTLRAFEGAPITPLGLAPKAVLSGSGAGAKTPVIKIAMLDDGYGPSRDFLCSGRIRSGCKMW